MPNAAPDPKSPLVTPDSTLGDVAFAVLRREFAVYVAGLPAARSGNDPDGVHRVRVAARRMRAALALFRDALPPRAAALRRELKWVAAALGAVRDIDVREKLLAEWDRSGAARAALAAAGERHVAERRLVRVLESPRHRRFLRDVAATLRRGPLPRTAAAASAAATLAPRIVKRARRKMRRAARGLTPESSAAEFHALRIRGKRLRYALEFLTGVYGAPARRLAVRVTALQEILGRHQDLDVARQAILAALARTGDARTSARLRALAARCGRESAALRERFPDVWARAQGRSWRRLRRAMRRLRVSVAGPHAGDAAAPRRVPSASSRRTRGR